MNILYLTIGHPDYSLGGTQEASYSLFKAVQHSNDAQTFFLACHDSEDFLSTPDFEATIFTTSKSPYEYILTANTNWPCLDSKARYETVEVIAKFIIEQSITVIHAHHFFRIGYDVIQDLISRFPKKIFILTLHEYLSICPADGQLLKTTDSSLCNSSSPEDCQQFFPHLPLTLLSDRKSALTKLLSSVNHIISPSHFHKDVICSSLQINTSFSVIENGLRSVDPTSTQSYTPMFNRFSFFGNFSVNKGGVLLLAAFAGFMKRYPDSSLQLFINGATQESLNSAAYDLPEIQYALNHHNLLLKGLYSHSDLPKLMAESDWVIVPSVWYENSPVVIQEAFAYKKPVLASNIGGLKEKVDDQGGITFNPFDPEDLINVFSQCIHNEQLHSQLVSAIKAPFTDSDCANAHLRLYRSIQN